jgi:hypothetical protein
MPKKETCELVRDAHEAVGKHVKPKSAIVDCSKKPAKEEVRVMIVDEQGNPLPGVKYRLSTEDGTVFAGVTDGEGYCVPSSWERLFAEEVRGTVEYDDESWLPELAAMDDAMSDTEFV